MMSNQGTDKITYFRYFLCANLIGVILLLSISHSLISSLTSLGFLFLAFGSARLEGKKIYSSALWFSFLALILYCGLSTLWAIDQEESLGKFIKMLILLLPVSFLISKKQLLTKVQTESFIFVSIFAFLLNSFLLVWQLNSEFVLNKIFSDEYVFRASYLNSGAAGTIVFSYAILVAIYGAGIDRAKRSIILTISGLLILSLVILSNGIAVKMAFMVSTVIFCLSLFWPKHFAGLFKTGILLSLLIIVLTPPFLYNSLDGKALIDKNNHSLASMVFDKSALHRIDIWDRCLELYRQKPLFGWGLANTDKIEQASDTSRLLDYVTRDHFLYPHNLFIELLVETGFVGLLLFLLFINFLINTINTLPKPARASAFAVLAAALSIVYFGFPVWRSWWTVFLGSSALYIKIMAYTHEEPL